MKRAINQGARIVYEGKQKVSQNKGKIQKTSLK